MQWSSSSVKLAVRLFNPARVMSNKNLQLSWGSREDYAGYHNGERDFHEDFRLGFCGLGSVLWPIGRVVAAPAIDTVRVDLNPLIDSAAQQEQFTVNIRRAVFCATQDKTTDMAEIQHDFS